ncbi:hypothetical protein SAMN05421812_114156 [Asanoa hainanensis]|uniref:Uncharacterized protein n=1 Tax=Asanoa hainanensis TaxID=560556 RepID=A0A239P6J0_9ACTN|nr:hypothetical protein [Asanoa hainanensis]SNT62701.1 hypothetical protein SAMN05421812_114156 [Asanoa hainanensis]
MTTTAPTTVLPARAAGPLPIALAATFTTVVEGLSLAEFLPAPVAFLVGAAWGVGIALLARRLSRTAMLAARLEDGLVVLGTIAMALFAFGGFAGLLVLNGAMDSSSLTGETLVAMFMPSIPVAIAANVPTELLVVPGLLVLGWRTGIRRTLILAASALYLLHRVWTYLVFASGRLDFAAAEHSTTPLTAAERAQHLEQLHLDDPRWILNLVIFGLFLGAAHFPRSTRRP